MSSIRIPCRLGIAVLMLAHGVLSQTNPRVGTWKLNLAKSFGSSAADLLGQPHDVLIPQRFRLAHAAREHITERQRATMLKICRVVLEKACVQGQAAGTRPAELGTG